MKCVCGYEYEEGWINSVVVPTYDGLFQELGILPQRKVIKGDKDFIRLSPKMKVTYGMEDITVILFMCPKCNTIQGQSILPLGYVE